MISFTKSSTEEDTEWSNSEMDLAFVRGLEIYLALKLTLFYNIVILMCVIPIVCVTNWRGYCSQTTQLS